MEAGSSPLGHCREPRHRDLFLAVVDATQHRSDTRRRQAVRADELRTLYERHLLTLKQHSGGE